MASKSMVLLHITSLRPLDPGIHSQLGRRGRKHVEPEQPVGKHGALEDGTHDHLILPALHCLHHGIRHFLGRLDPVGHQGQSRRV